MSDIKFTYNDYVETSKKLKNTLRNAFYENEKKFIITFYSLKPQWDLVDIPNIQDLPAVKRRTQNLEKYSDGNHAGFKKQIEDLENVFEQMNAKRAFAV